MVEFPATVVLCRYRRRRKDVVLPFPGGGGPSPTGCHTSNGMLPSIQVSLMEASALVAEPDGGPLPVQR